MPAVFGRRPVALSTTGNSRTRSSAAIQQPVAAGALDFARHGPGAGSMPAACKRRGRRVRRSSSKPRSGSVRGRPGSPPRPAPPACWRTPPRCSHRRSPAACGSARRSSSSSHVAQRVEAGDAVAHRRPTGGDEDVLARSTRFAHRTRCRAVDRRARPSISSTSAPASILR